MISNGFADGTWKTMIVLAATAAMCICVTNSPSRVEPAQTAELAFADVNQAENLFSPLFTNGYEALRF